MSPGTQTKLASEKPGFIRSFIKVQLEANGCTITDGHNEKVTHHPRHVPH